MNIKFTHLYKFIYEKKKFLQDVKFYIKFF